MILVRAGFILMTSLLAAIPAAADVVRLKASASVAARQDVRLGDIATVSGEDAGRAQKLADTVIIVSAEKSILLKSDDVLLALVSQGHGTLAGTSLQIAGARQCELTVGSPPPPAPRPAAAAARPATVPAVATPPAAAPAGASEAAGGSLADVIASRIRQELALPTEDVVIRFDTISPLLEQPVAAGRKWLCRPLVRTFLGTVPFEAQLVEGTKVLERLNVQASVQQMQWVPVLTAKLSRGDVVPAEAIRMERLPLDRKLKTLFSRASEVVGLESQKDLDAGTMLDQRDFRPAFMTHRNEPLTVVYVEGALSVQVRARALADAKLHERVRIRNDATHEEYTATVIGRNLAVAGGTLTAEQEKLLREGN
jgi:flagella basal body P-ring formation protein FlgA